MGSIVRAIAIGEARAKAVEQRINEHLKKTKRYLQTELSEGIDRAADNVFKIVQEKREKGVLQVDKVQGKAGNFVYMNGRSVGLSNKLNDFAKLAARMSVYESVLAKLTAKLSVPHKPAKFYAKAPEWQGK